MKWIGLCMILAGCSGMGLCFAGDYTKRIIALGQLEQMLGFIRDEISLHCLPLCTAIQRCAGRMDGIYQQFLHEVGSSLEQFSGEDIAVIWRGHAKIINKDITKKEYELFVHGMDQTGFLDSATQAEVLSQLQQSFFEQKKELMQKKEETVKLYRTIGILAGVFVCILLL